MRVHVGPGRGSMSKTQARPRLVAFDAARYLDDDEAIAEYMMKLARALGVRFTVQPA
jgi:DNA-binding phage protein